MRRQSRVTDLIAQSHTVASELCGVPTPVSDCVVVSRDNMPDQISVLFVCLGNICRSTMSEGVFRSLTKEPSLIDRIGTIDSCGTGRSLQNWDILRLDHTTLTTRGTQEHTTLDRSPMTAPCRH